MEERNDSFEFLNETKIIKDYLNSYESGDLLKIIEIKQKIEDFIDKMNSNSTLSSIKLINYIIQIFIDKIKSKSIESEIEALKQIFQLIVNSIENKIDFNEFISSIQDIIPETSNYILEKDDYINFLNLFNFQQPLKTNENDNKNDADVEKPKIETMMNDLVEDSNLLEQFVTESSELLDNAQFSLVDLEYDPTNKSSLDTVFRCFHTIKGSSAFLGLKPIELVGHAMEDLFALIRDGKITVSKVLIDFIFRGINLLHTFIDTMKFSNFDTNLIKSGFEKIKIDDYIFYISKIKKEYQIKKIGEILEDLGILDDNKLKDALKIQDEENKKIGEILVEKQFATNEQISDAIQYQQKQKERVKRLNFVKVSNEKLNTLIDTVGELVINQSILKQEILSIKGISDILERSLSQLEIITTSIKNLVLSMGMISVSEIFNRLRVVARNTASELGKAISLTIEGEDTELDRNIIEMLYDPLLHIVRNSIDHGIESIETRKKLNKSPVGQITISAINKGSNIELVVVDDGKGINKEKILEKAIEKGLIEKDKSKNLSDKEIYSFIFLPGFSTSDVISKVSGRGVGLDVVKKNIEQIHGRIEIQSEKGKFTRFIIRIPLTLAIIEGFVTRVGSNFYVFPFSQIEEILVFESGKENFSKNGSETIFFHRGMHIPVIYAGRIFSENSVSSSGENNNIFALIISLDQLRYCIIVDEVFGKQEIVIKNLGELLSNMRFFSGGTIFGDGTIGFVVDTQALIECYEPE